MFPWRRLPAAARALLSALAAGLILIGCAAPGEPAGSVTVYQPRGAVQCGSRGTAPEAMAAVLRRAGVAVRASACGSDGRLRPARCGAGTGELNLFDIAASDLARAQALGFGPLAELPGAEPVPCRR